MQTWKKIDAPFRDKENYDHVTLSPDERYWMAMRRNKQNIQLLAGFHGNYEMAIITVECFNDENNFEKIAPYLENVISSSPTSAPFSRIPGAGKPGGRITSTEVIAHAFRWREEQKYEEKQKQMDTSIQPVATAVNGFHRKEKKQHKAKMVAPNTEPNVPDEEKVVQFFAAPATIPEGVEVEEEAPIANRKKITISNDEFMRMIRGLKTIIPSRSDLQWDLRLQVYNPEVSLEEAARLKKNGAAKKTTYKISFGRFFKENDLDYGFVVVGTYPIEGKDELLLVFDSEYHISNEANVELSRYTKNGNRKMSTDQLKPKFGSALVENGNLKITAANNWTTQYTWEVAVIDRGDSEKIQAIYLTKADRKAWKGKTEPEDDAEDSGAAMAGNGEENN